MFDVFNGVKTCDTCQVSFYQLQNTHDHKETCPVSNSEKSADFRDGMPFLGGAPWLDLANSSFRLDGNAFDFLSDGPSFARWVEAAGFAVAPESLEAERLAALGLRGLTREVLVRLNNGLSLTLNQVDQLNGLLRNRTILEQARLAEGAFELDFPDHIAGPFVATRLASELAHFLDDYEAGRLKNCDNPTCDMVFYDRGKNNRRRWCTMSICGNRDKVANYRARRAGAKSH
ncbi:MAG: CGNR zinc finger domain-containing protein [Novosphingobium sp.]|uniref:CGNR zinc finger domain-containing protein n=1 Tax=Novosphingobium sp. TaxID=1874826 RepID=UPI0032BAE7DC